MNKMTAVFSLSALFAWSSAPTVGAQQKPMNVSEEPGKAAAGKSQADKTAGQTEKDGAQARGSDVQAALIAPDIEAAALWDGRKLVPFHALDNPKMVTAPEADFLSDKEYVLGLTINGESRAYPTRYVWWHHFINDKTDKAGNDAPNFLISYCSVCNTGIRYDSRVDGKPVLFDFYGLYNGVVIMCDRDTQTVWLQVEGRAVKGPRTGARLTPQPLLDTTWGHWRKLHPDTLVMSPDNEYKRFYRAALEPRGYDRFPMPFFQQSLTRTDKRLPMFDKVLGVTLAPASEKDGSPILRRAYPLAALQAAKGVINDTLGSAPVAAFLEADTQTACAVSRVLDGKTLTFEARDMDGKTAIYDKETGTRWSVEGTGEEGTLAGKSLTRLDNHLSQWYGWAAYFPDTGIYGRTDPPQTEKVTGGAAAAASTKP